MVGSIFFFLFIQSQRKFCTIEYTHTLFINSEWPCWPQQKYRIDLANKSSTNHCFWNVPRTHTHEHFWKSSKIKRYFEGPRPKWMNGWRFSLGEIEKKPNQMDKFFCLKWTIQAETLFRLYNNNTWTNDRIDRLMLLK